MERGSNLKRILWLLGRVKKRREKRHFAELWKKTDEWIIVDEMLHDYMVSQDGSVVWVVLYTGKCVRNMGIIGHMLGYSPCNPAKVVWSSKTIMLTTEAMWEEYQLEMIDFSQNKQEVSSEDGMLTVEEVQMKNKAKEVNNWVRGRKRDRLKVYWPSKMRRHLEVNVSISLY